MSLFRHCRTLTPLIAISSFACFWVHAAAPTVTCTWDDQGAPSKLVLTYAGKTIVDTAGQAWCDDPACQVQATAEPQADGVVLTFTLTNPTSNPARVPVVRVPGIRLPAAGTRRLDNWKVVQWQPPLPADASPRVAFHPLRTYPWQSYSPVLGLRTSDVVLGAAMLYDLFGLHWEVHTNYAVDARAGQWTLEFAPATGRAADDGEVRKLEPAALAPGASATFRIALQLNHPDQWLETFSRYREHFRKSFGEKRHYSFDGRPICAYSLASGAQDKVVTDDNPRGFYPHPIHVAGWKGFPELIKEKAGDRNFRRLMLWGSVGRYRRHPEQNMVWEIGTAWTPAQLATEAEFRRLSDEFGLQVGLWCGLTLAISEGFDSGKRHPWNPDDPADLAAVTRELELARKRGVRMIGLDATLSGLNPVKARPGAEVVFRRLLPLLRERFPDMEFIIEPAAADFLHLWGPSFMWENNIGQPFAFAEFLAPGQETVVALKQSQPRISDMNLDWQRRVEELEFEGSTPLVFSDVQGREVTIPRRDPPATWPEDVTARVGDLEVRFDGTRKWTLHRVSWQAQELASDNPGSHWAVVAKVRDIGFIGSGHVETGNQEEVLGVRLTVDGQALAGPPERSYTCKRLEMVKESRIHHLKVRDRWLVADDAIQEEVWLRVEQPEPLDLLYVFMYPWLDTLTEYVGVSATGERLNEVFQADADFHFQKPPRWLALYNRATGFGVVMTDYVFPANVRTIARLWDQPKPYKKHYLQNFTNMALAPGDVYRFKVRVVPFQAPAENWQAKAEAIAAPHGAR